ncbi:MAG TPA: cyclic nucleotide-binding domain-containing protein [Alphaproteobacteria bacterium]|nr:cyclic nucleotide-binding domain-containing protein [Alphaproteobacteria bacterium]
MITVDDLRSCELFAGLGDDELAEIAAIATTETYDAGQVICTEQEIARRLFILQAGCVQVHIRLRSALRHDGDATVEEVEPGRIFGWSSLVRQRQFTASARAVDAVRLIVVNADDLNALFDRDAHLGFVVMKQLAEVIASRLRHTREICEQEVAK